MKGYSRVTLIMFLMLLFAWGTAYAISANDVPRISKEDLKVMLDEYYSARGWNLKTGIPERGKLAELGLGYVADDLKI